MTPEEIRKINYADVEGEKPETWARTGGMDKAAISFFLREIAAQLAELNGHAEAAHEMMRVWAKAQGFIR